MEKRILSLLLGLMLFVTTSNAQDLYGDSEFRGTFRMTPKAAPAVGSNGSFYVDQSNNLLYISDGVEWSQVGGSGGVGTLQQVTELGATTDQLCNFLNNTSIFGSFTNLTEQVFLRSDGITKIALQSGTGFGDMLEFTMSQSNSATQFNMNDHGLSHVFFSNNHTLTDPSVILTPGRGGESLTYYASGLLNVKSARVQDVFNIVPSARPTTPSDGDIYNDSSDNHLYFYNGSVWVQLDN